MKTINLVDKNINSYKFSNWKRNHSFSSFAQNTVCDYKVTKFHPLTSTAVRPPEEVRNENRTHVKKKCPQRVKCDMENPNVEHCCVCHRITWSTIELSEWKLWIIVIHVSLNRYTCIHSPFGVFAWNITIGTFRNSKQISILRIKWPAKHSIASQIINVKCRVQLNFLHGNWIGKCSCA